MSAKDFLDSYGIGKRVDTPATATGAAILKIPVAMIDADPNQPRRTFPEQRIAELAESLKRHGQLQAVRVRKATATGRYMIVAGECRLRAARLAGLPTLDAVLVPERVGIDAVREEQIVENLQRSDLSPLEAAEAYRGLLVKWSCSQAELARRLGVSPPTVSRALALLEQPAETKERIASGESVRQATSSAQSPRRRKVVKSDKRRAVELELRSGFVRVKRGATLEELVAELQTLALEQRSRPQAA